MMDRTDVPLALPSGATWRHQFTLAVEADPDDVPGLDTIPDFTGCVVRADVRRADAKKGPRLLALASDLPATPAGSQLTVVSAGVGTLVFRVVVADEDTDALPYDAELAADVEIVHPSGEVDAPLRLALTTDGSYTHA